MQNRLRHACAFLFFLDFEPLFKFVLPPEKHSRTGAEQTERECDGGRHGGSAMGARCAQTVPLTAKQVHHRSSCFALVAAAPVCGVVRVAHQRHCGRIAGAAPLLHLRQLLPLLHLRCLRTHHLLQRGGILAVGLHQLHILLHLRILHLLLLRRLLLLKICRCHRLLLLLLLLLERVLRVGLHRLSLEELELLHLLAWSELLELSHELLTSRRIQLT